MRQYTYRVGDDFKEKKKDYNVLTIAHVGERKIVASSEKFPNFKSFAYFKPGNIGTALTAISEDFRHYKYDKGFL